MRYLTLLAAAGVVGATTVACTDDSYYGGRTQYVTSPAYSYTPAYTPTYTYTTTSPAYYGYGSAAQYSNRNDRDRDGVPNWRDQRPDNPYRY